jgi:CheY-like chemotaxis protein
MQGDEIGLHLQIRDTGIGIPTDRLDKIFESFTQVDASTTRRFGGTGLGLTITAELVRLMQGQIWVQSNEGEGSVFHVAVPLKKGTPPAITDASRSPASRHIAAESPPRALRVLVVDDHAPNRQLVTTILSKRGHHCVEADSGQQAIQAALSQPLDVAVMDVQMPDIDGYEVTATIRQNEQETGQHLPILALTAHAMAGDQQKCLDAGMDAYLAKPLRPKQLVTLVESMGQAATENAVDNLVSTDDRIAQDESQSFSFEAALESLDNEKDLLEQQMRFFVNDGPILIEHIRQAIADQNHRGLELPAHRLKGLLARYAYHDASALAYDLEQMGKQKSIGEEAEAKAGQLAEMVDRLVSAMKEYLP